MDGKTRFVAAMELFKTSRRFDMPVRMAYVRAYIDNDIPALIRAEQAYLEMIRASCEFYMHVPRLRSPEDFVVTFRSFVTVLRQHGFGDADVFYRDRSGEVVNGQHCLAIAAVLGIDVRVQETELAAKRMSYMRFRRCHVPRAVAYYAIRQYMRFNDGARVVPWWRKTPKGAVVWYRGKGIAIVSFPGGVPAGFRQSREEAQAIVLRKFRDLPFPDWRRRADLMRLAEPLRKLRKYRYRLAALFGKGKERERARCRVFEMARRQWGYDVLADFASDFHINFIRRPRRREVPRE